MPGHENGLLFQCSLGSADLENPVGAPLCPFCVPDFCTFVGCCPVKPQTTAHLVQVKTNREMMRCPLLRPHVPSVSPVDASSGGCCISNLFNVPKPLGNPQLPKPLNQKCRLAAAQGAGGRGATAHGGHPLPAPLARRAPAGAAPAAAGPFLDCGDVTALLAVPKLELFHLTNHLCKHRIVALPEFRCAWSTVHRFTLVTAIPFAMSMELLSVLDKPSFYRLKQGSFE